MSCRKEAKLRFIEKNLKLQRKRARVRNIIGRGRRKRREYEN